MVAITRSPGQAVSLPQPHGRTSRTPFGRYTLQMPGSAGKTPLEQSQCFLRCSQGIPLLPEVRRAALCFLDTAGLDSWPHPCSITVQALRLSGRGALRIVGSSWVGTDPHTCLYL